MTELFGALHGVNPALFLIAGGALTLALPWHHARKAVMLAAPLLGLAAWFATREPGVYAIIELGPLTLETFRYDALSRVWGLVFLLAAFLKAIYALHNHSRISDGAAMIYAGAAVGAVFAGDFLTLFVFWELTALFSAPLIFAAGTPESQRAGLRYLAIQVFSGVLLLGGAALWASQTGSWTFGDIGLDSPAGFILLIAFGIKAAFPLMHMWMQDAYPKASVVGAVVLSAFTTKLAIYALARGFAGTDILITIGAIMAAFPVLFIIVENDLRRTLAYALNNQLGFMVVGVGVGTPLGLNAAAANAFVGVFYMALMFMAIGAVMHRTGTARASELGGLFRSMPVTGVLTIIGALAMVGAPLFSGFVTKTLVLSAVSYHGDMLVYALLVFAAAGVMELSALKVPFFAFFGQDRGHRVKEAPLNMLVAMGLAAFLCVYLGTHWQALYGLLPFAMDYAPYTADNVIGQVQILLAGTFAFAVMVWLNLFPLRGERTILDADWLYRRAGDGIVRWTGAMGVLLAGASERGLGLVIGRWTRSLFNLFSPAGSLSRIFPSGLMAIWAGVLLAAVIIVAYFSPL
ncbi:MAG: Na(+)/H(+) antiporter subunit D [Alphaproteobacteria bacterium]|nr:Na(+)/H(+) antiporter subunit D [Alphaproteobacteria bacterium]